MGKRAAVSGLSRFVKEAFTNEVIDERPTKKQKTATKPENAAAPQWIEKYDATNIVPHRSDASQVPEHLQKCRFFLHNPSSQF